MNDVGYDDLNRFWEQYDSEGSLDLDDLRFLLDEVLALRSLLVTVEGFHVIDYTIPLADLFQPDWRGHAVLRRAGCYERGSRPVDGPMYLSPPESERGGESEVAE